MNRLLFSILLLYLLAPISTNAKKKSFGKGLYWELSSDGTLTISGEGDMPNFKNDTKRQFASPWYCKSSQISRVVIMEGVTSIGAKAFSRFYLLPSHGEYDQKDEYNIQFVEIPNSVSIIGSSAFEGCVNLKEITIPNSVKEIGTEAFRDCRSLTTLTIPNSVISIGPMAFQDCKGLISVSISNSLPEIDNAVFRNCSSMQSIVIPNTVKSIGGAAFRDCISLVSVNIPNSVLTIGWEAFKGCKRLTSICLPSSITFIGKEAFVGCNFNQLCVPNSVTVIKENAFGKYTEFKGEIISLPSFMMKEKKEPSYYGISQQSWNKYKNGLRNDDGRLILPAREGRKTKELTDEERGINYYIVEEKGSKGILNQMGDWIVPLTPMLQLYSEISLAGDNYIKVTKNNNAGILTLDGTEIIPTSRGYTSIDYNSSKRTFAVAKAGYTGVCDAQGNEISMTKLPPTANDIMSKGGYASAVEVMNGSTKYYKVSKNGKYGLTNAEGKVIVPAEMEALEQAGTGYLRYKLNGFWGVMNYTGKILIDTDRGYTKIGDYVSFTKRFPYEMAGWKGECDAITGRQVSKIKVETPKQQVVKQEPQPNPKGDKDTIIIKHDPIPMQVWKQCDICGGSGRCQACANIVWGSGSSRECLGCGWSRKCQWCAGQGGHYEVEYR